MSDKVRVSTDVFFKVAEARSLLQHALGYDLPEGAADDIKQALQRIERLDETATLLVSTWETAPGNKIEEATRAIARGRKVSHGRSPCGQGKSNSSSETKEG